MWLQHVDDVFAEIGRLFSCFMSLIPRSIRTPYQTFFPSCALSHQRYTSNVIFFPVLPNDTKLLSASILL